MIQITPQMRILLAVEAVDFRKGIDGLARTCREVLKSDPFSGYVFVFRNTRATAIKVLVYDGQGFWLCQKRLSRGRFRWWPKDSSGKIRHLIAHELQLLIWNGNPAEAGVAPLWKKLRLAQ
jgi:transposase